MNNLAHRDILQKIFILATGGAANTRELISLHGLIKEDGDASELVRGVNQYMKEISNIKGTAAAVSDVVFHAAGVKLSEVDSIAVAKEIDRGGLSWAEAFGVCINSNGSLGGTLSNRAKLANDFVLSLESEGKADWFNGNAITTAVKNLLGGVQLDQESQLVGEIGLKALAGNLASDGLFISVDAKYLKDATVFVDANKDSALSPGEWAAPLGADGRFFIKGDVQGGKIVVANIGAEPGKAGLSAPLGAAIISPVTTMVQSIYESGGAASVGHAETILRQILNLSAETSLLVESSNTTSISPEMLEKASLWGESIRSALQKANESISLGQNKPQAGGAEEVGTQPTEIPVGKRVDLPKNPSDVLSPKAYDASMDAFVFYDKIEERTFAKIHNFGQDDNIIFNGEFTSVEVRTFGRDLRVDVRLSDSSYNQVTLVGVLNSGESITSIDGFNARSDLGDIYFIN